MIEPLGCRDQQPAAAEGRIGADLYVATDRFRATLRHPQDALTIAHVGGLSLLDLSTWPSGGDRLHEAVPLVRGGWLDVVDWAIEGDTIRVEGPVVSLPDQPAEGAGTWAEVRWRFDGSTIEVEGADGFYVHPRGPVQRDGEAFAMPDLVLRDGGATDLGGAVRTDSPVLHVDTPEQAWSLEEPLVEVSTAASELELLRDDVVVGRVSVGETSTVWLEAVDAVRAVGAGRAPGPWVSLDAGGVDAPVGDQGAVELLLTGTRGAILQWESDDGRSGERVLEPGGGTLAAGAGTYELTLPADPRRTAWTTSVQVLPGETVEVEVPPRGVVEGPRWALLDLSAPSDRNRTWRGSNGEATRRAHARGADAAAFLIEDDTTAFDPWDEAALPLRAHGGMVRRGEGPTGPWRVAAWPIAVNTRKNAHGALGAPTDDPIEAFVSAWGGADQLRHVQVDLPTLAALGPAHTLPALPDLVLLDAPAPDLSNWTPWLDRLAEGRTLTPTAEVTWVPVGDRRQLAMAEVDQALFDATACAGNGPLLSIRRERRWITVQRLDAPEGVLELWTDEGLVLRADGATVRVYPPTDGRWMLAVVRDGDAWAVTGPLWLVDPATGAPLDSPPVLPTLPALR